MVSDFIKYLAKNNQKLDLNQETLFGISLFDYAIITHHTKMFEVLMKETRQIDINRGQNLSLEYIVEHTICCGIPDMLDCLVEAGADLNSSYDGYRADTHGSSFWLTVKYDRKDMAGYFIQLNNKKQNKLISWDQQDRYGRTAVMSVVYTRYPGWAQILEKLLSNIKDIEIYQNKIRVVKMYCGCYQKDIMIYAISIRKV